MTTRGIVAGGLTGSGGSSLVGFLQSGTGAVARTVQSKERDIVSVLDFMSDAQKADVQASTGAIDVTAAWQAAVDALPAAGGQIEYYGKNLISSVNINKSIALVGKGGLLTGAEISASGTTGNVLNVTASGFYAKNLVITSASTRTSGAFVNLTNSSYCLIDGFRFVKPFIGIESDGGSVNYIMNGHIRDTTPNGTSAGSSGIYFGRTTLGIANYVVNMIMDTSLGATAALMPTNGIVVQYQDALVLGNLEIIRSGTCVNISPGTGQVVTNTYLSHNYFDNSSYGIRFSPTGTGAITRTQVLNCWTSSHANYGVLSDPPASGFVKGVTLLNHQASLNLNQGVYVTNQYTEDFVIDGGYFAGNTNHGIIFDANAQKFTIRNIRAGASNDFAANGGYGITLGATCANFRIYDNDLTGNTGGAILNFSSGVTTGTIVNNKAYNPVGPSAITVTASPFTYTTGQSPEVVTWDAGTLSLIVVGGVTMFTSTGKSLTLPPNTAVVTTYTVAPTMKKYVN